ncbi:MAG: hypothetical protein ACPGGH_03610 [Chitinophagales bacterium]
MIRDTNITFWTCMLFGFFGLLACQVEEDLVVEGWKPVYQGEADLSVSSATPRAIVEAGKIYKYGPYILVGESGQGIHVFDNNDPSNPVSIAFINVPLNEDMAIRNDVMFIDIGRDVVAVDVSDWANVQEIGRLSGVYNRSDALYPEGRFGYFECVDTSRGVAVDWVSEELVNPKCRR